MNALYQYYIKMFTDAAVGTVGYLRTDEATKKAIAGQTQKGALGEYEGSRFDYTTGPNYYLWAVAAVLIVIIVAALYFTLKK